MDVKFNSTIIRTLHTRLVFALRLVPFWIYPFSAVCSVSTNQQQTTAVVFCIGGTTQERHNWEGRRAQLRFGSGGTTQERHNGKAKAARAAAVRFGSVRASTMYYPFLMAQVS
jgi:hypothetical protein